MARYTLVGKTCYFYIKITQGPSAAGQHIFSLPVQAVPTEPVTTPPNMIGQGAIYDGDTTAEFFAWAKLITSTTVSLYSGRADGTFAYPLPTSPTSPMIWANGQDSILIRGKYETLL